MESSPDKPLKRSFSLRRKRWKAYADMGNFRAIARRYFVMNAFDGALTMLGVVIGASMTQIEEPNIIISAGIAGSIAMGVSGFSGAYMAESAERARELKKLERAMLSDMDDTMHEEAARFASVYTALIDALSPAMAALAVISPFFFVHIGLLSMGLALFISVILTMIVLFCLGVYLARVMDESILRHGLKMLVVGLVTALLCSLVSLGLGGSV
jgi:predicted membrane protein (TIGR00267 family)